MSLICDIGRERVKSSVLESEDSPSLADYAVAFSQVCLAIAKCIRIKEGWGFLTDTF
jgi:hypothetical protein